MDQDDILRDWLQQYSQRMFRLAYAIVKDRTMAEDRVQESFVKAYYSMNQLKNRDNPLPWLMRIIVNQCRSSLRRRVWDVVVDIVPERAVDSAEDTYFSSMQSDLIRTEVMKLPDKYRLPIILFHFEELSIQEISEILLLPPGNIRTRLSRGREKLKKSLGAGALYGDKGTTSRHQAKMAKRPSH